MSQSNPTYPHKPPLPAPAEEERALSDLNGFGELPQVTPIPLVHLEEVEDLLRVCRLEVLLPQPPGSFFTGDLPQGTPGAAGAEGVGTAPGAEVE